MGENTRKDRRTKVLSMTVRYRSATLGEFIEHHSYDVSRGGMFIKTPSPFPPGTLLKFEVKIAEEQRVMQGVGRVVWKRDLDGDSPDDPAGMGIKFIKIDDASRAVIDKLVEGRAPGQEGAFEHLPDAKPRMFPSTPPPAQAVTEDPTVVKPAAELLKDALRKTGEGDGDSVAPPSVRGNSAASAVHEANAATATARATAETADLGEVPVKRGSSEHMSNAAKSREGSKRDSAKDNQNGDVRAQTSATKPSTQRKDEEEGRGRALLSILIALIVAAGIYFLTKQGNQPASRPSPPAPAPVVEQAPLAPVPSADLAVPIPDAALSAAPFELEPVPAASAEDAVSPLVAPEPAPEPAAVPKPAPVRAPKPRPAPKPPAPTTSPSTEATPATTMSTATAPASVAPASAAPAPATQPVSEAPAAP